MIQHAAEQLNRTIDLLLAEKNIDQASRACEQLVNEHPDYPDGWYSLSRVAIAQKQPYIAAQYVSKALELQPDNNVWLLHKARCLQFAGDTSASVTVSRSLIDAELPSAFHFAELGRLLSMQQQQTGALAAYRKAQQLEPGRADIYYSQATIKRYLGDFEGAEQSINAAICLNHTDGEAQLLRSQLRRQTRESNHIDELEKLSKVRAMSYPDRVCIHYALGKEHEDLSEYRQAFEHIRLGANIRRKHMRYRVETDEAAINEIINRHSADQINNGELGHDNSEPIFVLGLPRTGSTLVERILSSHSAVHGAGELNNFAQQLSRIVSEQGKGNAQSKLELIKLSTQIDSKQLGKAYIDSTRPFTGHTSRFVDKLPFNYLYVGLIACALPKAKIIQTTRHPMDTCYAIYKRHFRDAYPFSYDLTDLGRYYIAYTKLMGHWHSAFPGRIYQVSYENLVTDLEGQCHKLLKYCELPWEDACLRFYEKHYPCATASAEQVRQPIYASSIGRWRKFEVELQPLVDRLQFAGVL